MDRRETVPSFGSIELLEEGIARKNAYDQCDLYPRDGQSTLGYAEEMAATLVGSEPDQTLIFGSGMAAIDTALEAGLHHENGDDRPLIAFAGILYSQSSARLRSYGKLGIDTVNFDSGCSDNVASILDRKPKVIFSETVANGPGTPVLDYRLLLEQSRNRDDSPVIILDNTLPLSTGLPLAEEITEQDKVIVVESGTKSYTQNGEISGIAYSKHPELLKSLKILRREKGTIPGVGSTERIKLLLPESRRSFDSRNKDLFKNTAILAKILQEISEEDKSFVVSNPVLPNHDNHDLAVEIGLPDGGSPVLFLQPCNLGAHKELAVRIWDNELVRDNADLGQSFGFDRTRILPDDKSGTVRVSGGADTDTEALGEGLRVALLG